MIPKFRAWFGSKMYGNPIVHDGEFYLDWRDFEDGKTYDGVALMQSTGLFDKNGVEIFEGDLVRLKYSVYSDFEVFKVTKFRGGAWRIDNNRMGTELWLRNKYCEIIGNVYENPELVQ